MLNVGKLIESFREIVGWPYVSPGSNDQSGIDCSGAFVRAYRAQGASIYHGSNRIIRAYCSDAFRLTSAEQLEPGMAVFKWRNDGEEPVEYKPGGAYYDPDLTGNYYHIGLVASVYPLQIIHASSPAAKVDTTIQGVSGTPWGWAAHLDAVDYGSAGTGSVGQGKGWGTVTTVSGGLNMRVEPYAKSQYLLTIPKGSRIQILQESPVNGVFWAKTVWGNAYGTHTGWVCMDYVTLDGIDDSDPDPGDEPVDDPDGTVSVEDAWKIVSTAMRNAGYSV